MKARHSGRVRTIHQPESPMNAIILAVVFSFGSPSSCGAGGFLQPGSDDIESSAMETPATSPEMIGVDEPRVLMRYWNFKSSPTHADMTMFTAIV
jgi:hypothetical protein